MIPFRDAVPSRDRPVVTLALIGAGLAAALAFALLESAQPGAWEAASGGIGDAGRLSVAEAWIRSLLPLIRPAGWLQALACALALWIFGPTVEDRLGHDRFVVLCAGCAAVAAALASALGTIPLTSVALLPGAVGGVIGAHAALYPRARVLVLIPAPGGLDVGDVPSTLVAGLWMVTHLADSVAHGAMVTAWSPRLAFVQIVAAILTGAAAATLLKRPERMRVEWWNP
jgi:membrane associated rhomboid family serine protease